MKKTGSKKVNLVSLDPVKIDDWIFKVSTLDGNVMVFAVNTTFQWSSIRFFSTEESAKNFVDLLIIQTENLKNNQ